jgi:alpha-amylase
VRWQAQDHLVIERSTKALVGINDSWSSWQNNTVSCDFAPGTVLKDFSGANGTATVTVNNSQTVSINTPPCNGTANGGRRGYSVWAPVNAATSYNRPAMATTQEWELADDLGDSDSRSLQQGGQLLDGSTAVRTAGRIYAEAGKTVTYALYPTDATRSLTVTLADGSGTTFSSRTGTGTLTGTYTPTGWITLQARNAFTANPAQRAFVKVTYTAPAVLSSAALGETAGVLATTTARTPLVGAELNVYPNPTAANRIDLVLVSPRDIKATLRLLDLTGRLLHEQSVRLYPGTTEQRLRVDRALPAGVYQLHVAELGLSRKVVVR